MSYQGLRYTAEGIYVRYRVKGQSVEAGPFDSPAKAIATCRNTEQPPPDTPVRYLAEKQN